VADEAHVVHESRLPLRPRPCRFTPSHRAPPPSPVPGCPQDMRALLSETVDGGGGGGVGGIGGARGAGKGVGRGGEGTPGVIKFNSWPQIAGISRSSRPSRVALLRERCGGRSRGRQRTPRYR
jgi:hypothetical protein